MLISKTNIFSKNYLFPKIVGSLFSNFPTRCNQYCTISPRPKHIPRKTHAPTKTKSALSAVVKIFTTSSCSDPYLPWVYTPQEESWSSGFVISGKRILTCAHSIADNILVHVRKHGCATKYRAKVEAVSHDCDLGVLTVEKEEFWEGTHSLELGGIPLLRESVTVFGYPIGGDNISITNGLVSRIEFTQYDQALTDLMVIQVDATIDGGNSGGPVISSSNKVVGVVFQSLVDAENINEIIPVPVINHFLSCLDGDGRHPGFCSLGVDYQTTENVHLRNYFQMLPGMTGVLVHEVDGRSSAKRYLKNRDIITAFDGVKIANDGTVAFRGTDRISFEHLVSMKKPGEKGALTILRSGKVHELAFKMKPIQPLVPTHRYDKPARYFIFAGLVFVPLTERMSEHEYQQYNTLKRKQCNTPKQKHSKPQVDGTREIVYLSEVLLDEITSGYEKFAGEEVHSVNGQTVKNLHHLYSLVENCREESLVILLEDDKMIVLNYQMGKMATAAILEQNGIPWAKSSDFIDQGTGKMQITA